MGMNKESYSSPELVQLNIDDLEEVSGGTGEGGGSDNTMSDLFLEKINETNNVPEDSTTTLDPAHMIELIDEINKTTEDDEEEGRNGDVGGGRGRGGGCNGVSYNRHPRTFSSGRNSKC